MDSHVCRNKDSSPESLPTSEPYRSNVAGVGKPSGRSNSRSQPGPKITLYSCDLRNLFLSWLLSRPKKCSLPYGFAVAA